MGENADAGFSKPIDGDKIGSTKLPDGIPELETIGGFEIVSPFDAETIIDRPERRTDGGIGGSPNSEPKRRPGRPRGTTSGKSSAAATQNLSSSPGLADIESLLLSLHLMGATILNVPELELSAHEAKKLSDAIRKVSVHYAMAIEPKKLALIELTFAAGSIYGPRAILLARGRNKAPKGPALVQPIKQPTQAAQPAQATAAAPIPKDLSQHAPSEFWPDPPIADTGSMF